MPAATNQKIIPDSFAGELLLAIGISLFIYLLSGFFFPFLFVLPLPLLLFSFKRGMAAGLTATGLVSLGLFFSAGGTEILPLVTVLGAGLAGSFIIKLLKKNPDAHKTGIIILLVPLVIVPAAMFAAEYFTGSSVRIYAEQSYANLEQSVNSLMNEQGIAAGNKEEIQQLLKNVQWFLLNLYPALFAAFAVVAVLISLALMDHYSGTLVNKQLKWTKLRNLQLPDAAVLLFIIPGAGILFTKGDALFVFSNLLAFAVFVFMVQGIALLSFLNHTFGVKPFMQTMIYLGLLMIPYNIFLLAAFGMLDVWIPMRKKIEDLHHKLSEDFE